MNIQMNDNGLHLEFAPLSLMKPIGQLRMGILTFRERWEKFFPNASFSFATELYLQEKYPLEKEWELCLPANVIPNEDLVAVLNSMEPNTSLFHGDLWLGTKGSGDTKLQFKGNPVLAITKRWHLFQKNDLVLKSDFILLTEGRQSQKIDDTVTVIGDRNLLFLENDAVAQACVLNTTDGPIYLGGKSEIMEGSLIRGPFALCENACVKMGAKVYGATTIGPNCKVGGEIGNSVFQAFSNKGHDGFVGNSLIGEWCNLGADTNTSNLKNNYSTIRTYNYANRQEVQTDLQFMGLTIGDHSKCGINSMFNTATVVGVSCNIYGSDYPQKFIPSFSWGSAELIPYKFDKAIEAANGMMNRRNLTLSEAEIHILTFISKSEI